jgi:glutamate/tyrosine decarboxylase-like PLP-dependent enzyme
VTADRSPTTLDPDDWEALAAVGHRALDDAMELLEGVAEGPVWRVPPAEVQRALTAPVPRTGTSLEAVYDDVRRLILANPHGNIHPRFWGWVNGTGTPVGVLGDMLAAAVNPNVGGGNTVPALVEQQVIDWMKALMGFPPGASGLLGTGGSMANFIGIASGVYAKAEVDLRDAGIAGAPRRMMVYASSQVHSSVDRAVRLLGLGAQSLRRIPVDEEFRIDTAALRLAIEEDRSAGRHPAVIVGTAGTVNTGAFDDVEGLADLATVEDLWLHVDGAFGAMARLAPEVRALTTGVDRADSLAFDLHKWLYVPYDAGCVLVRDPDAHRLPFDVTPPYLAPLTGGISAGTWFSNYGIELSRGFRALKVWMSLRVHGTDAYAAAIAANVAQARYLAERIAAQADLELLAPVPLNIVCFRYRPSGLSDEAADPLNRGLLIRLQEEGTALPSHTLVHGRFAIRVAITNHRSRYPDFDLLVERVIQLGREIASSERSTVAS